MVSAPFNCETRGMLDHLPLKWFERLAVWILMRSPRVGLLVLKPHSSRMVYVVHDPTDEVSIGDELEPLSMQFERIFHQPAYGETE